jgi:hypothetical protein
VKKAKVAVMMIELILLACVGMKGLVFTESYGELGMKILMLLIIQITYKLYITRALSPAKNIPINEVANQNAQRHRQACQWYDELVNAQLRI